MENVFEKRSARRERMMTASGEVVSDSLYNIVMGVVILYGLLINVILCRYFPTEAFYASINPIVFFVAYIIMIIAGSVISKKSDNPIISFIGYNLIVFPLGICISAIVIEYGGMESAIVGRAFLYTLLITLIMICASSVFPKFFSKIGGFLFIALIALIIIPILGMFIPALAVMNTFLAYTGAGIFSLYIGYDMYRAQSVRKTIDNAIDSAVDIYVDVVVLFTYVLEIVGNRN